MPDLTERIQLKDGYVEDPKAGKAWLLIRRLRSWTTRKGRRQTQRKLDVVELHADTDEALGQAVAEYAMRPDVELCDDSWRPMPDQPA